MDHKEKSGPPKNSPIGPKGELIPDPAVDEFLTRLKQDMRHPRPGTESIAAALQVVQRMALEAESEESVDHTDFQAAARTCIACGSANRAEHKFCATCGVPLVEAGEEPSSAPAQFKSNVAPAPGQHHYYHHYHHHYFPAPDGASRPASAEPRVAADAVGREPAARGGLHPGQGAGRQGECGAERKGERKREWEREWERKQRREHKRECGRGSECECDRGKECGRAAGA